MRHFQDTGLSVRFDAPLAEARAFSEGLIGRSLVRGEDPWHGYPPDLDWWPQSYPSGAEGGEDMTTEGPEDLMPPVRIMVLPRGNMATVWLGTFTT